jgi:hypothetical protein
MKEQILWVLLVVQLCFWAGYAVGHTTREMDYQREAIEQVMGGNF